MFDKARFESMPKFDTFNFWFTRQLDNTFSYDSKENYLNRSVSTDKIFHEDDIVNLPDDVQEDFLKFTHRPEYTVGQRVKMDTTSASSNAQQYLVDTYEDIIAGIVFMRCLDSGRVPDDLGFKSAVRLLQWLRGTDFYYCPGSTRFHDAEPYGLIFHTLNVYNNIVDLKHLEKFRTVNYASAALVALCHDFTKIGNYEQYLRNVKNDQTQQWEQVPSYRWKCNPYPFGHGVASMYITSQFFRLSVEEMLAIRWHMGEYRVASQETGELEDACEQYRLVRMIQFADQLACVKY